MSTTIDEKLQRQLDRCRVPHYTGPFEFSRSHSYYWIVKGPVPLNVAQEIAKDPAAYLIRVAGHAGCPQPVDPWITWRMPDGTTLSTEEEGANFVKLAGRHLWALDAMKDYTFTDDPTERAKAKGYIETYHIDSEVGLRVFVDYLRWYGLLFDNLPSASDYYNSLPFIVASGDIVVGAKNGPLLIKFRPGSDDDY